MFKLSKEERQNGHYIPEDEVFSIVVFTFGYLFLYIVYVIYKIVDWKSFVQVLKTFQAIALN